MKFIYSEKATKFCEIFPLLLTICTEVKSREKISQNFVAFSEYMNFIKDCQLRIPSFHEFVLDCFNEKKITKHAEVDKTNCENSEFVFLFRESIW